jgi:hypothetical protein
MRWFGLLPLLVGVAVLQPAAAQPPAGYLPPSAPAPGTPPYASGDRPGGGPQAYNQENCGTPDQPKPCPPMPKVPLRDYPGYKQ